jgi:hypothetical protein
MWGWHVGVVWCGVRATGLTIGQLQDKYNGRTRIGQLQDNSIKVTSVHLLRV